MEEQDLTGPKLCQKLEVGAQDPHVVQVGTIREFLSGEGSQVKQEPHEGLPQCWEAQWQEFLKTMQAPRSGWKTMQGPQTWSEEEARDMQACFKGASGPRGECETQTQPGLSGNTQGINSFVKVEGETADEEGSHVETQRQHFRQFCYWEAEGPREVYRQLQQRCRQWLKPERHTKEQILELVILEQFLSILPQETQGWVREHRPGTCTQAVALAEDFLTRRQETERLKQKTSGPLEEVMVNSPKLEQDPSEPIKMQFSVKAKSEVDGTSFLETCEHRWKHKEPFRPKQADVDGLSPERIKGASFYSLEMNEISGSQQVSESHRENHPGKSAKQAFHCKEGLHQGTFPGGIYNLHTKTAAIEPGETVGQDSDLLKNQETSWRGKPQECLHCGEIFLSTLHLMTHLRSHTGEKPYAYSDRGQGVRKRVRHERPRTGEEQYDCSDCGKSFSNASCLGKHQRLHAGEKPYNCSQCGKCFSQRSVLWRHKRTHAGEKRHTCSDCGKGFCDKNSLSTHQRAHTGEKPFECSECGKRFGYAPNLARHKKLHTGEKPFQCSDCGKHLCDKKSLVMHKRTHTGEKPYTCSECGKNFSWKGSLLIHERTHTGEKPYPCSDCSKSFCDKQSLITHRRAHTGEKPYECSKCGKRFGYAPNLVRHKKLHTGEKPYQCSHCGKWFSQPSDLLRHETIHTREKPHKCTDCDKSFSQKASLIGHRRTHTGEKPYECSECEKRFCSFSGFRKHQRIHTGVKL